MDLFRLAKVVRLRSYEGTYLVAGEDGESVRLQQNGTCDQARWTVECTIRGLYLRSHYGRYLAVSNYPADAGDGRVVQKPPEWRWFDPSMQWEPIGRGTCVMLKSPPEWRWFDPSMQWEPIGRGTCVMLKSRDDKFLRVNHLDDSAVTHSWLSRETTLDLMLWDVDVKDDDFNSGPTYENLQVKALIVIMLLFIWFAHDILGLFSLISKLLCVVFWLVGTILFAPIWLIHSTWSAITTWRTIVIGAFGILWVAFGKLLQLLEFYDQITNLLHRFGS